MKRITVILTVCITALFAMADKTYTFDFSLEDFTITKDGSTVSIEAPEGYAYFNSDAYPCLPYLPTSIINPRGYKVESFTTQMSDSLIFTNIRLEEHEYIADTLINLPSTGVALFQPTLSTPVILMEENAIQRGFGFSAWAICPFIYDGRRRQLSFVSHIEITVKTTTDSDMMVFNLPVYSADILFDQMLNQEDMVSYNIFPTPAPSPGGTEVEKVEYLLVTNEEMAETFKELVDWKIMKGIHSRLVTIEEILAKRINKEDDALTLKRYIYSLYSSGCGLKWVTLAGDVDIIPSRGCYTGTKDAIEETLYDTIPADMYFACMDKNLDWDKNKNGIYGENEDGTDIYQDFGISRIPANNVSEATVVVEKILNYEKNPLKHNGFNKHLLCGNILKNMVSGGISDAKDSGNFLRNKCNQYSSQVTDMLFDSDNDFIEGGFTSSNFNSAFNSGYSLVTVITHGNEKEYLMTNNVHYQSCYQNFTNIIAPLILSISCNTNHFDYTEKCLSEDFFINPYGCIGYVGPSRLSFSTRNSKTKRIYCEKGANHYLTLSHKFILDNSTRYDNRYFTNLSDILLYTKFQVAKSEYFEHYSKSNKWNILSFNTLGDSETPIITSTPKEINANIHWTGNSITVSVSDCPQYRIAITENDIEPKIIYAADRTATTYLQNVPSHATITITAPNRIPYISKGILLEDVIVRGQESVTADRIVVGNDVVIQFGELILKYKDFIEIDGSIDYGLGGNLKLIKQ